MKSEKIIVISFISLALLLVIGFIIFFLPSFFIDEFSYVDFIFTNGELQMSTTPSDLLTQTTSKWTDVSAQFQNIDQKPCEIVITSQSLSKSFTLNTGEECGVILPKKEAVSVSFCGHERRFQIN